MARDAPRSGRSAPPAVCSADSGPRPTSIPGKVRDADVDGWISQFKATHDVGLDSEPYPLSPDRVLPHCFVIDPRTMKVVDHALEGPQCQKSVTGSLEKLLVANGAPPADPATDAGADATDAGADVTDAP